MKATYFMGHETFEVRECPIPKAKPGTVVVKNYACGVCGTDVHIYHGEKGSAAVNPPVVLGHEYSGVVTEVGEGVKGLKIGDHVTIDPNIYCGECEYCRNGKKQMCRHMEAVGVTMNGGFEEYSIVPAAQALLLDPNVPLEYGAMSEPLACCLHGIDRAEINKNVSTTLHITGDARVVLELLLSRVAQKANGQWMQQARSMMEEYLSDELFEPRKILRQMAAIAPEITVATDVGQHQMWSCQYYHFSRPGQLLTSGGFGTMGFGLGAAMGAAASDPAGRPVALVTGDGSFRMNLTELSTIGYYGIPVIVVIFNNGTLGMVRQWQTLFFGHRYSQTTLDRGPDFMKLAAAYGLSGARVNAVETFAAAFKAAVEKREPCIIECMLDIDEMVAPMVAPGSPIDSFCLN